MKDSCIMLDHEREFFLMRIITGILRYGKLEIRCPNQDTILKASEIYKKTYNRCLKKKLYTDEQALKDMNAMGIWTDDDQETFELLPNKIDDFKVNMFENILRPLHQDKIAIHLQSCKDQYYTLLYRRHKFDYLTCNGIAHFAKWQYIISHSTYYKNKRFSWRTNNIHSALDYYYKNAISEDQIRLLCKTQPWSSYWSSRESCGSLFNRPSTQLTTDQIRLIYWSSLYDQVYQQTDHDPEKLVENNDVFDGWLLSQKRERAGQKKAAFIKNPKIANSQEIFVSAKSKEEAKEINSMNTGRAKKNFMERMRRIKQEGEVKHHTLNDVQQRRYEK